MSADPIIPMWATHQSDRPCSIAEGKDIIRRQFGNDGVSAVSAFLKNMPINMEWRLRQMTPEEATRYEKV